MLLALTLCVASALPVTEVARPGGPVPKPVVQVLLRSEEEVKIDPGAGKPAFSAARGMLLQASDVVKVSAGAWVALAILGNQQVVRLDDDLSLQVAELAMLNAPAQPKSVVSQLDALLTSKERERTERLIGWHASQTAANTPPPPPTKTAKMDQDDERGGGGTRPKPPPPPASMPPPTPTPTPTQSSPVDQGRMEPVIGKGEKELEIRPKSDQPGLRRKDWAVAQLQACLAPAAADWSPEVKAKLGQGLTVEARLKDDEVLVRLPLGIPAPGCVAEYFKSRGDLTTSWTSVTVPLK